MDRMIDFPRLYSMHFCHFQDFAILVFIYIPIDVFTLQNRHQRGATGRISGKAIKG